MSENPAPAAPPASTETKPPKGVFVDFSARPLDYWLLWVIALTSLALNALLINTLLGARRQVAEAIGVVAQGLGELRAARFTYVVQVDQEVPVDLNVPIRDTLRVPIDTVVPFNTQLQVPIELPFLGTRIVNVPVQTTVPVQLDLEVPLNLDVPISATVPVRFALPVQISLADTPLDAALAQPQSYLDDLAAELRANPLLRPTPTATAAPR